MTTAASGMKAQQMQVDTIANNIANVNTNGFKKNEVAFRSLLYQTFREPGAQTSAANMRPTGLQVGSGTEVADTMKLFGQGELVPTGNQFSLAIAGDGFFEVILPSGELRYTRDGNFRPDGQGRLTDSDGHLLRPEITMPAGAQELIIGEDGTVSARLQNGGIPVTVGNLQISRFPNAAGLKAIGGNLFEVTASSGQPQTVQPGLAGAGTIRQGFIERSNVQIVDEMVSLILAQRNYEVNSRAIRVSDEMMQQVNQMIR